MTGVLRRDSSERELASVSDEKQNVATFEDLPRVLRLLDTRESQ